MKTMFGATMVAILVGCLAVPIAAFGQQKTVKECRDEWRTSTDVAKGTQKDYVAKCRSSNTVAAPTGTPTPAPPAATAPAKTVRACRDEWRASTDPNKGTQKDYVAKCRGEGSAAAPTAPAPKAPAAAPSSAAGVKTIRECRDEWRASTDPNKGTQKDYIAKCRSGGTAVAPPAAPAAPPKAAAPAPSSPSSTSPAPAPATPPPAATAPAPSAPAPGAAAPARPAAPQPAPTAAAPTGAGQYPDEAQAKARCPADIVVWVNLNSHIYHFSGTANYGRHFVDKGGAYMCEKDALRESFRAAENEKRP
jgi:hypothetical protein